jgi:hypothetical protein
MCTLRCVRPVEMVMRARTLAIRQTNRFDRNRLCSAVSNTARYTRACVQIYSGHSRRHNRPKSNTEVLTDWSTRSQSNDQGILSTALRFSTPVIPTTGIAMQYYRWKRKITSPFKRFIWFFYRTLKTFIVRMRILNYIFQRFIKRILENSNCNIIVFAEGWTIFQIQFHS